MDSERPVLMAAHEITDRASPGKAPEFCIMAAASFRRSLEGFDGGGAASAHEWARQDTKLWCDLYTSSAPLIKGFLGAAPYPVLPSVGIICLRSVEEDPVCFVCWEYHLCLLVECRIPRCESEDMAEALPDGQVKTILGKHADLCSRGWKATSLVCTGGVHAAEVCTRGVHKRRHPDSPR